MQPKVRAKGRTEAWKKVAHGKSPGTGKLVQYMYMDSRHQEGGTFKLIQLISLSDYMKGLREQE